MKVFEIRPTRGAAGRRRFGNRNAKLWLLGAVCSLLFPSARGLAEEPGSRERLPEAGTILFLGDSITWAGDYVADFETWLRLEHPEWKGRVLNLGLPSETVSGLSEEGHAGGAFPRPALSERLVRVLDGTRPDLVIACYGINCGIYQSLSESRFAAYREGIESLRAEVLRRGARIILVTPPVYDHARGGHAPADYDTEVLKRYADWLLSRRADGWSVVDLHGPMRAALDAGRTADPGFHFQPDGVHPTPAGHGFMAERLIGYFGGGSSAGLARPDSADAGNPAMRKNEARARTLIGRRMALLRDAWLSETGHDRPGLPPGLPIGEAETEAAAMARSLDELLSEADE